MLDWWGAEWEKRIAIKEAEGEREALIKKAEGEAGTIREVERAKRRAREKMIKQVERLLRIPDEKVAFRFIKIMDTICRDMTADDVAGRRYIEVLEAIAKSDGQKTIVIGGDRQLLWPGRRIGGALEGPEDRKPDDEG
jgi:regulator of protease activity HflC (stomatin/prohibitin superfamily)